MQRIFDDRITNTTISTTSEPILAYAYNVQIAVYSENVGVQPYIDGDE